MTREEHYARLETMTYMLCRNRVADYAKWKAIFDTHAEGQQDSGLRLLDMWREIDDPNNVFFIFEVTDIDKAKAFISSPDAVKTGEESGVIDGECHFVESAAGTTFGTGGPGS